MKNIILILMTFFSSSYLMAGHVDDRHIWDMDCFTCPFPHCSAPLPGMRDDEKNQPAQFAKCGCGYDYCSLCIWSHYQIWRGKVDDVDIWRREEKLCLVCCLTDIEPIVVPLSSNQSTDHQATKDWMGAINPALSAKEVPQKAKDKKASSLIITSIWEGDSPSHEKIVQYSDGHLCWSVGCAESDIRGIRSSHCYLCGTGPITAKDDKGEKTCGWSCFFLSGIKNSLGSFWQCCGYPLHDE